MSTSEMPSLELSRIESTSIQANRKPAAHFYRDLAVGLLLLAAPFLLFPKGYGLLALLLLPAVWLLRWLWLGRPVPRTPLDWPILLMMLMVLVSMAITFDLSFSIGKIAGILLGIVVYYLIIDLAQTKLSFQRVIFCFILCGMGLVLISALGTRWKDKFPLLEPLVLQLPQALQGVRQAEQGFNSNQVGGVLIFFIPLQLVLLGYWLRAMFTHKLKIQIAKSKAAFQVVFQGFSLLMTAGLLLLTQSRGAIGGLIISLVVIAAIHTWWGKVLALGLFAAVWAAFNSGVMEALVMSGLETEAFGTMYLDARVEIWFRALQGMVDFPLGMGMNAFRRLMPILYPSPLFPPHIDMAHAHNHLLQAGLDLGIPGLIAYLALWLLAGYLLIQVVAKSGHEFYRMTALGLIGGFTAYFIYGLTDTVALGAKPGFVFWWALALAVAVYKLYRQEELRP